jgi:hypothetical protein
VHPTRFLEKDGDPPEKAVALALPSKYAPPELRGGTGGSRVGKLGSADMWGLGCLIWEVYNGASQLAPMATFLSTFSLCHSFAATSIGFGA